MADVERFVDDIFKIVAPDKPIIPIPPDVVEWGQEYFYITETKRPIVLQPVQKAVLQAFFERTPDGRFKWGTGFYCTIKKSGKTAIAGMVQRWACETWGDFGEIYHMGNKLDQAMGRAFKYTKYSIMLSPKEIQDKWELQEKRMRYLPNHSFIQALPVNAAGEAGGNQRLTTWTELHGYTHEEENRMWDELQPVPTQFLSFRFAESYAGYEGESLLLQKYWDMALNEGVRLHDEYPIYGVESARLIAYIDTGEEARRMPWQTPSYYEEQTKSEDPTNFRRIHRNEWVGSTESFIPLPTWDALEGETNPPQGKWISIGVDASVSRDCTAVCATWMDNGVVVECESFIIEPSGGQKLDYGTQLAPILEVLFKRYKVRVVAYDEYQLHHFMTEFAKKYRNIEFYAFPQNIERLEADTAFKNRLEEGLFRHSGNAGARQHIQNARRQVKKDGKSIRIVKAANGKPIDWAVAASMSAWKLEHVPNPKGTITRARARGFYGGRERE